MPAKSRHETPLPPVGSSKDAATSKDSLSQPGLLWSFGFFVNIIFLYCIGTGVVNLQDSRGSDYQASDRMEHYGVILLAGCPRCALISKATCENSTMWWHGHPFLSVATSGLESNVSDEVPRGPKFWAYWSLMPSFLVSFDSASGLGAWDHSPAQSVVLFLSVWSLLIQDVFYFLIICQNIFLQRWIAAFAFFAGTVSRQAALWMYAWLLSLVYPVALLNGAHHMILGASLLLILSLRVVSIAAAGLSLFGGGHLDLAWLSVLGALAGAPAVVAAGGSVAAFMPFLLSGGTLGYESLLILIGYPIFLHIVSARLPVVVLFANVLVVEQLLDWGLANLLLLETLRHKTSLMSYISIRLSGGLTSQGGKGTGSTASGGVSDDTRRKFYVFKDTFWGRRDDCEEKLILKSAHEDRDFDPISLVAPNIHAFLAARSSLSKIFFGVPFQDLGDKPCTLRVAMRIISNVWGIIMILMPSLKFRCTLDDLVAQNFKNDPLYAGTAWFTLQDMSASWIGPWGTVCGADRLLCQGYQREITRMPLRAIRKVLTGVFQFLAIAFWLELVDIKKSPLALMVLPWL